MNQMSRYHLAALAIQFGIPAGERATALLAELNRHIEEAVRYTREHFEDPADIRDWKWSDSAIVPT
jgi:xylulose-5-phosphate/fructose-6-phosphate phosphoketolase